MARGSSARQEAAATEAVETPDTDGSAYVQDEQTLRRQAYNAAETRIKDEHKDEFRAFVQEEAAKRGVTYEFRKTEEEKAREQVEALFAKFPHLRDQPTPSEGEPEQG